MKKTIMILMAALACSLLFAGSAAASSQGGLHDGEYLIYDAADLVNFAAAVNGGQTTLPAKLMADIDLTAYTSWDPIGTNTNIYAGIFDGNGHTISNLHLNNIVVSSESTSFGLFRYVTGTIKNVCIDNFMISGTTINAVNKKTCAALCSFLVGGTIDSCCVTNSLISQRTDTTEYGGWSGFICGGILSSPATVSNSYIRNCTGIGYGSNTMAASVVSTISGVSSVTINNVYNADYHQQLTTPSSPNNVWGGGIVSARSTVAGNIISNCVALFDSMAAAGASTSWESYAIKRIQGQGSRWSVLDTYQNNYALSTMTIQGNIVTGGTASNYNGANCYVGDDSQPDNLRADKLAFWRDTLGWDFDTVWYWDDVDNLPKLQVFRNGVQISSVTVTSSDLAAAGHDYINATVTATSSLGQLTYQWYRSTSAGAAWTLLPGQTTATLSYIPTGTGRNFLKVIVSDGTSTVDSYADAGFTDVYVRVLQAYDPLPVVAKTSSIQARTSEPYQALKEFDFDISATIYDVAWLGNDTAYVAAGNAIYAISGYLAEAVPVSDWTGNTIRKSYIGQNRAIIEDVSSNVAVYDYKTRSAKYISHDGADHVAITANYAAIVKDSTLYVYDKNNRLIGSIATGSIKSIYGNDKLDVFTSVSTAGYKPITVYSVSGSTIVKTDLDNYQSPDILPIRYTDNYILTYNSGSEHTNIITTTASGLTTVYSTQSGKYTSMQATVNNALIGAKQNTVEIRGVNGALVGTYDTGGNINDVSISRDTGLFAIVGGEDNQAYFLNKYESSNWVLGQKVNFRETVYKSQISSDGTFAVVGTTNKLFLWKYTEIIESTFFINGVVIGSDGMAYANKAITIDTDTVITDDSGFFVYPVRPGQTYTITAGSQTTRYTATNQALQTLSIRIQSQLIAQDVTYSAVYNAESGNIEMSYADSGAKTTAVTWKIRDTHSGQTVYQHTSETGSFFVPTDKQSSNYFVSVEADRQNTVVKNTWSITPSGVGQEVNLFGLDDTGKNILFGFFLIVLTGLFGYLHQHIGTIIIAFTAAVLRYLGLITVPWIMILIAVVVSIVAAIAHRSEGK